MKNYFNITVSKDGKFLFSISDNSAKDEPAAAELFTLFDTKFPVSEGFEIRVYKVTNEFVKCDLAQFGRKVKIVGRQNGGITGPNTKDEAEWLLRHIGWEFSARIVDRNFYQLDNGIKVHRWDVELLS